MKSATVGTETYSKFDPLMDSSEEFLRNPYPVLHLIAQAGPIQWSDKGNQWLVCGLEEANIILRSKSFGKQLERWKNPQIVSRLFQQVFGHFRVPNILRQDPPEHNRVRGLISGAFTPSVVHQLEPKIQAVADEMIEGLNAQIKKTGSVDLISRFAFPLPITVIADLLGVPTSDQARFKVWSTLITNSLQGSPCPMKMTKSLGASFELRKYLKQMLEKKLKEPDASLLSAMAHINLEDEGKLSEKELISNSMLILIAGHETTVNLIGNGMRHLLSDAGDWRTLSENPQLMSVAVEEILRYDPPVQIVRRIVNENTEVAGKQMKKDDGVTILIGACNRDSRSFPDPDKFDLERANKKHISFGGGIHYCLGAELARTEARIAISSLLEKLPDLKLKEQPNSYKGPYALRGLQHLMVGA